MGKTEFAGDGGKDVSNRVPSSPGPVNAPSKGDIEMAGDGAKDVYSIPTNTDTKGPTPQGGGIKFAGLQGGKE